MRPSPPPILSILFLPATTVDPTLLSSTPTSDITAANGYQRDYYFRAWTRAPVYLLGVAFAFFWIDFTAALEAGLDHPFINAFQSNARRRLTAPVAALFGAAFFLLAVTAYGSQPAYHNGGLPKFWDVAYLALSRSAWCVGLLLLCFLLFQGYGGPIKALLENRVMAVLSRLSFAAYLVHPARTSSSSSSSCFVCACLDD